MLNLNIWDILKDVIVFFKKNNNVKKRLKKIAEILFFTTGSDLCILYEIRNNSDSLVIDIKSNYEVEKSFTLLSPLTKFILESKEIVVTTKRHNSFLDDSLLSSKMNSSVAIPIKIKSQIKFILILNSKKPNFYNNETYSYIDNFIKFIHIYFE